MRPKVQKIRVIDSHTGGEPTRVVWAGFPDLGNVPIAEKLDLFQTQYDHLRSAIVREPRGHEAMVGALLCKPFDKTCAAAVIFFNNSGFLKMCGHGTIGLIKTLEFQGKISFGTHRIETTAGIVEARLEPDGLVAVENVPSFRIAKNVSVEVEKYGQITGDIAWGGNWFFLIEAHTLKIGIENLEKLTEFSCFVRNSLEKNGITGENGESIDHIEIFSKSDNADSRNFVLCPGKEYDRSPCGTGTSAKLACLFEDGKLQAGQIWRQEGITGSIFEGSVRISGGKIIPTIRGSAFVTSESVLILDENDPFCFGIR